MSLTKLKVWSDYVKARDGKCVECGSEDDLHAHHIKPKCNNPELMLDPDNGKTLCYRCHKREHERNRPIRIRSNRPQRRTLETRIKELEEQLRVEKANYISLNKKLKNQIWRCKSGICERFYP